LVNGNYQSLISNYLSESESMTDKKKHKHEEVYDPQPTEETMSVDGEQINTQMETLQTQLAETESKVSEYKDGWARSQAEFQNYRKRMPA